VWRLRAGGNAWRESRRDDSSESRRSSCLWLPGAYSSYSWCQRVRAGPLAPCCPNGLGARLPSRSPAWQATPGQIRGTPSGSKANGATRDAPPFTRDCTRERDVGASSRAGLFALTKTKPRPYHRAAAGSILSTLFKFSPLSGARRNPLGPSAPGSAYRPCETRIGDPVGHSSVGSHTVPESSLSLARFGHTTPKVGYSQARQRP
jgi:hypothetical protein